MKFKFTGGVNAEEAAVAEVPEYTGPLAAAGEEPAPTVKTGIHRWCKWKKRPWQRYQSTRDHWQRWVKNRLQRWKTRFTGGVNAVEAAVHEIPEFKGGVNGAEAAVHEVPEYRETPI